MAKRGGSNRLGKVSFQALCTPPDPSSVSFAAFEKELLDVKAHLMALRPAKFFVAEEFVATAFFITIFSFLYTDGACPTTHLLLLGPFSKGIFRSEGALASFPYACSSLPS